MKTPTKKPPRPARVGVGDRVALGLLATKSRPLRSLLSACGIAIGIAALVAVMGMATSQKADLMSQLNSLGTNLLSVTPGQGALGGTATLPAEAPAMINHLGTVEVAASTYVVEGRVYKTDRVPSAQTSGVSIRAADLPLLETLRTEVAQGRWLDSTSPAGPVVVLGSKAAKRLGVDHVLDTTTGGGVSIFLAGQWFAVIGILEPVILAPELDSYALIGLPAARAIVAAVDDVPVDQAEVPPTSIYTRVLDGYVEQTRDLLPRTASPESPLDVRVTRPSEALAAQAATDASLKALSFGLGAVGLGVGGIGIVNVMLIAVLERRREIGVRRALGATRRAIRGQFLIESIVLAAMGGILGVGIGMGASLAYATSQEWGRTVPWTAIVLGLGASLLIGALAGAYPATRAARVSPTEALRTT
ncbi:MAG: ABC transporter permease [Micrococcales bacterium]|nr:ABC transporter permease [Micrococcales bacterium]